MYYASTIYYDLWYNNTYVTYNNANVINNTFHIYIYKQIYKQLFKTIYKQLFKTIYKQFIINNFQNIGMCKLHVFSFALVKKLLLFFIEFGISMFKNVNSPIFNLLRSIESNMNVPATSQA